MQPLAKRSRALAMSSLLLNTGMPTPSTLVTGDFTNASTMSRSWIIRSSTTPMSVLRAGNGDSRWHSMNFGSVATVSDS